MTLTVANEIHARTSDADQFLTFTLLDNEFGIEILQVQEIKNFAHVTPIPNMPESIRGVLNLRGTVVPIVDLRSKFNMPETNYGQFAVIIVVNVSAKVVGLVVDGVSDVLNVSHEDVENVPDLGADVDTRFLRGIAKSDKRMISLLDLNELLEVDVLVA